MKISAVITLYNLEKYIDDAIQSVLRQTRQPDEIIVVDDCSTDGSANIVGKYRDRIIYIRQEKNIGALKNSLSGLKAATGDIVAFLDGDDVWMPEKLEKIEKEFLQDEEVVLVSHDFIQVDENLQDLNILNNETRLNTRRITKSHAKKAWSKAMREAILLRKGFWLGSAYAVRKKAVPLERFETVIARHPAAHLSYLDMTLGPFIIASNPTFKVGFVNEVLFKHRAHGDNNNRWSTITSIENALRNIERWQSVNSTTYHLIADVLTDQKIEKRYTNLHEELELLKLQFTGKKAKAVGKFISLSPFLFKEKKIVHEFIRLLVTIFWGAETFFSWKAKLFERSTKRLVISKGKKGMASYRANT
ncbi:MAG TPA: glycosyltransferase [Nitrososphaeraceae archaeon]|nr:glycosyltransferase [Nitrososphaeraceae archaeon]